MTFHDLLKKAGILLGALLAFVVLVIVGLLAYREYQQQSIARTTAITTPAGIESLEHVDVNGSQQWIYIRGHDTSNPVLLHVHGGPGSPVMGAARRFGLEAEKHFTIVHWDQRASGKSRREGFLETDLEIQVFVDDGVAVIDLLRQRFSKDKVYLVGHSWGSMLGTLIARDYPELLHAYVGMGQLVDVTDNEKISFAWVREQAVAEGNQEAISALEPLVPPYDQDPEQMLIQRNWLYYYGGGFHGNTMQEFGQTILTSPEYTLLDILAMVEGMLSVAVQMWPEMVAIDFRKDAINLKVPVYFFTGRHDYNTPFELTEEYYEVLSAPHKEIIWFENSSHMMNISDPEFYQQMLIEKVLQPSETP
ncbi:MAG: alpha/beta fold hydrolase [Pseudomonadales bacterium]|nr:alpha/beta fold hydrolase [Pseudomonadales bacterium]